MNFLKDIFKKKDVPIQTHQHFWAWFEKNEKAFYDSVKNEKDIEQRFFDPLSAKLEQLKDGFYFLTGMYDDHTVELILTADGTIKNIVFVEELVAAAPSMAGWKFTALKPENSIENVNVKTNDYSFNDRTLSFYENELSPYPDEIDITIVYSGITEDNRAVITNGIYLFLEIYLGELKAVTTLDNLTIIDKGEAAKELIPIEKLKDYLNWREKEFIEKYEGLRHGTKEDVYSIMEATLTDGKPLMAVINTTLLNWGQKASHPWILRVEMKYDGENYNGLPEPNTYELLSNIEDEIIAELKDFDGYLNIGRQTANSTREVYFACKDFRKPSKYIQQLSRKYASDLDIAFDIYKDKYWRSFDRFMP